MATAHPSVCFVNDPIVDDPNAIQRLSQHLRGVVAVMKPQIERLEALQRSDSQMWTGPTADGFKRVVQKLPSDLTLLKNRYEGVAGALETFNGVLCAQKEIARDAAARARAARDALAHCKTNIANKKDFEYRAKCEADRINASRPEGQSPVEPAKWSGAQNLVQQQTTAQQELDDQAARVTAAITAHKNAADEAARRIAETINDKLANDDSVWGSISRQVKKAAQWAAANLPLEKISEILDYIGAAAGLLALCVGWIPVIGQALAVALAAIALTASVLSLFCDIALMIDKRAKGQSRGWHDWAKLGVGCIDVALNAAGLGAARAALKAAKVAKVQEALLGTKQTNFLKAKIDTQAARNKFQMRSDQVDEMMKNKTFRHYDETIANRERARNELLNATGKQRQAEHAAESARADSLAAEQTLRELEHRTSAGDFVTELGLDTGIEATQQAWKYALGEVDPVTVGCTVIEVTPEKLAERGSAIEGKPLAEIK